MDSADIFKQFYYQIKQRQFTANNVIKAETAGMLVRRDVSHAYEGLFMQNVVSFERLIETLFIRCLSGRLSHPRSYRSLINVPNMIIARSIVLQGRNYIDWLPIDKTIELSKIYFESNGNIFDVLGAGHKLELKKILLIRNVIAHQSDHSVKKFNSEVVSPIRLPRGKKNIIGYLLYSHTVSVSKFDYHTGELVRVARDLCS